MAGHPLDAGGEVVAGGAVVQACIISYYQLAFFIISLLFFVAMAVCSMDWLLIVLIVFAAGMVWNYKDESP